WSVQSDFVVQQSRAELVSRNQNLTYDPVTGINKPYNVAANTPVPSWGIVSTQYTDGYSNYYGQQSAVTKRFSQHWQLTTTWTLSWLKDALPCPGPTAF